jgi:hypothetical protein
VSAQATGWVLTHADAQGADRLVLLAIANYASENADGDYEAYPSIERIAEEAGLDAINTVKKALRRLEKTGQLRRKVNGAPDERMQGNRRTNLYTILTRQRSFTGQLGERFAPDAVAAHPAFAAGDPGRLPLPSADPIPRGRRVSPKDPPTPQVWMVDGRLYLRNGHPDMVDPDDELIAVSLPSGGPPQDPPGESVDNPGPGGSSEDTPEPQGGPFETRRGVLSGRAGGSSDDAQGGPERTPKPKEEPIHEPSLNRAGAPGLARADSRDPVDAARRRLAELLARRADRPTPTTGLRTASEAFNQARARNRTNGHAGDA